jgi:thermitase
MLAMVAAVGLFTASAQAKSKTQTEVIPGQYLVKYKGPAFSSLWAFKASGRLRLLSHHAIGKLVKIEVSPADESRTLAQLAIDKNIEYIVPNQRLHILRDTVNSRSTLTASASAQALRDQWHLKKIHAEEAWTRAGNKGSHNVLVAVIDDGIDYEHGALKPNLVPGYDFYENDSDPMDRSSGHGTHVAGLIGATGLVANGTIGISPEVTIMPIRFIGDEGGDLDSAIKAIDYAIQKGAKVLSNSWGGAFDPISAKPLIEAVKRADDAGAIFIVAAANDGDNNDKVNMYPANAIFPNTITVAASDSRDGKPSWSNYGRANVHLASPGNNILSTMPNNSYASMSGTSMATPIVSGVVALLLAQDPTLTGAQVRALLQLTGAKVNIETACRCRIDAGAAMDLVVSKQMFITPAAATLKVGEQLNFTGTHGVAPFTFTVADSTIGSINADGTFTGTAAGETTVTVVDSTGQSSTSLAIRVLAASKGDNGTGNKPPTTPPQEPTQPPSQPPTEPPSNEPSKCPYNDPAICDYICYYKPEQPFCH